MTLLQQRSADVEVRELRARIEQKHLIDITVHQPRVEREVSLDRIATLLTAERDGWTAPGSEDNKGENCNEGGGQSLEHKYLPEGEGRSVNRRGRSVKPL